jgi:hypothetical protein
MKKIFIITASVLIFFASNVNAQWSNNNGNNLSSGKEGDVKWEQTIIDLGTIKQYNQTEAVFKLTNTGGKPIIITNAKGSCGCTEVYYPKSPVAPGKTVKITALFDAEDLGVFNKTVTITINIENSTHVLHINGEVVK